LKRSVIAKMIKIIVLFCHMKYLVCIIIGLSMLVPFNDIDAKIKRSPKAIRNFKKENPCPSTGQVSGSCPGYVVDHIVPLKHGGADKPENMQWLTIENHKEKHRTHGDLVEKEGIPGRR
jgi:hypothetical protein